MTEKDLAELARLTCDLQLNPPKVSKAVPNLSLQNIRKKHIGVPLEVRIYYNRHMLYELFHSLMMLWEPEHWE